MALGINEVIGNKKNAILLLAKEYGAENLRVFGSVARGEATEESDIDFLAHFPTPDFYKRMEMLHKLEDLFGRKIDLISDRALNQHIAPYILQEARPI